jgi:hypothetical protein
MHARTSPKARRRLSLFRRLLADGEGVPGSVILETTVAAQSPEPVRLDLSFDLWA